MENKESQFLFVTWQAGMGRSNNRSKYTDVIGTLGMTASLLHNIPNSLRAYLENHRLQANCQSAYRVWRLSSA